MGCHSDSKTFGCAGLSDCRPVCFVSRNLSDLARARVTHQVQTHPMDDFTHSYRQMYCFLGCSMAWTQVGPVTHLENLQEPYSISTELQMVWMGSPGSFLRPCRTLRSHGPVDMRSLAAAGSLSPSLLASGMDSSEYRRPIVMGFVSSHSNSGYSIMSNSWLGVSEILSSRQIGCNSVDHH